MKKDDIERKTLMDMKGLVFNDEMRESIRSITMMWLGAYDAAFEATGDAKKATEAAIGVIAAMTKGGGKDA